MKNIDLLITLTAHERDSNNVTIAFTVGINALEKGKDTVILLLSDAVHLGAKGYGDKIDIGAPFKPVRALLDTFIAKGGRIAVCSSCMQHNGVSEESLYPEAEIVTASFITESLFASQRQLQLN